MQGPQGRLLRAAFARLAGLTSGMDPRFGATTLADAQNLLMRDVAGAETPADLAAMVGPNAAGDAVGRSFRTASANTGLNADGATGTLYADAGGGMITDAGGLAVPLSAPAGDAPTEHLVAAAGSSGFGGGAFGKEDTPASSGNLPAPNDFTRPVVERPRGLTIKYKAGEPWFSSGDVENKAANDAENAVYRQRGEALLRLPTAERLKIIDSLPMEERFNIAGNLAAPETNSDQRRLLLQLQGVNPERVEEALALDRKWASNQAGVEQAQDAFMQKLQLKDLPPALRKETEARMLATTRIIERNPEKVYDLAQRWGSADTAEKKRICQEWYALFAAADPYAPDVRLDIRPGTQKEAKAVASVAPKQVLTAGSKKLFINETSPAFQGSSLRHFLLVMTGAPHELTHVGQGKPFADTANQKQRFEAVPTALSMAIKIDSEQPGRQFSYMTQTHEMQAILVQMAAWRAVQNIVDRHGK